MKPTEGVAETIELKVGIGVSVNIKIGPGSVGENIGPQAEVKNINPMIAKSFLGIICLPHIKLSLDLFMHRLNGFLSSLLAVDRSLYRILLRLSALKLMPSIASF